MPLSYPQHVIAHAEPSAPTYHVYCPTCAGWVGGAWAEELWQWKDGQELIIHCPRCRTTGPGKFEPDTVLSFGVYAGRAVSSLKENVQLDYLEFLLQTYCRPGATDYQQLRLAILWRLGWLDTARQKRAPGPDLERLLADLDQVHWQHQQRAQRQATEREREEEQKRREQAYNDARWEYHARAQEQQRQRTSQQQQQRAHTAPPPAPAPARLGWQLELELTLPISKATVRAAYHRLSKIHHPDVGGAVAKMQQLNQAYEQALVWLQQQGKV